jgi:hypothetical protein
MQGYLSKQSNGPIKVWKKRYFIFSPPVQTLDDMSKVLRKSNESQWVALAAATVKPTGLLMSFASENDTTKPLDLIDVRQITGVALTSGKPNGFSLTLASGKVINLAAPDASALNLWIKAFETEAAAATDLSENPEIKEALEGVKAILAPKSPTLVMEDVEPESIIEVGADESVVVESTQEVNEVAVSEAATEPVKDSTIGSLFRRSSHVVTTTADDTSSSDVAPSDPSKATKLEAELHSGWVEKRSDYLKKWNKRLLVVSAPGEKNRLTVTYYRPGQLQTKAGEVEVEKVEALDGGYGNRIMLTGADKKTWIVSVGSAEERDQWLLKLTV